MNSSFLVSPLPWPSPASSEVTLLLSNLLHSRGSKLQAPAAQLGFAPTQVGDIKLMALQVKSIQLKLLPSPSPAHFRSQRCGIICSHSPSQFMCPLSPLSTMGVPGTELEWAWER